MVNQKKTRKIIAIALILCFAGAGVAQAYGEQCAEGCCISDPPTENRLLQTVGIEGSGQHATCCCKTGKDPMGDALGCMHEPPVPAPKIFVSNQPFMPVFSFIFDRLSVSIDSTRSTANCCDVKEGSDSDFDTKAAFPTFPRMDTPQSSALSQIFSVSIEPPASRYRYWAFCRSMALAKGIPLYLENLTFLI